MIQITIPGNEVFTLKHLVLDYNGTMAFDGILLEGVKDVLEKVSKTIKIHVITADTFGHVHQQLAGMDLDIVVIKQGNQDIAKKEYIQKLGEKNCVCIGNGANDRLMLQNSGLGIALIQGEGASTKTIMASDIVCTDFVSALELLLNRGRLTATLRL